MRVLITWGLVTAIAMLADLSYAGSCDERITRFEFLEPDVGTVSATYYYDENETLEVISHEINVAPRFLC